YEQKSKIAMRWKSTVPRSKTPWIRIFHVAARLSRPRLKNIERTFRFIEKVEDFSGPQALARHPVRSPAPTASNDDGIERRSFLNGRLDTSGSSTPILRKTGSVQSDIDRADVYRSPSG